MMDGQFYFYLPNQPCRFDEKIDCGLLCKHQNEEQPNIEAENAMDLHFVSIFHNSKVRLLANYITHLN